MGQASGARENGAGPEADAPGRQPPVMMRAAMRVM